MKKKQRCTNASTTTTTSLTAGKKSRKSTALVAKAFSSFPKLSRRTDVPSYYTANPNTSDYVNNSEDEGIERSPCRGERRRKTKKKRESCLELLKDVELEGEVDVEDSTFRPFFGDCTRKESTSDDDDSLIQSSHRLQLLSQEMSIWLNNDSWCSTPPFPDNFWRGSFDSDDDSGSNDTNSRRHHADAFDEVMIPSFSENSSSMSSNYTSSGAQKAHGTQIQKEVDSSIEIPFSSFEAPADHKKNVENHYRKGESLSSRQEERNSDPQWLPLSSMLPYSPCSTKTLERNDENVDRNNCATSSSLEKDNHILVKQIQTELLIQSCALLPEDGVDDCPEVQCQPHLEVQNSHNHDLATFANPIEIVTADDTTATAIDSSDTDNKCVASDFPDNRQIHTGNKNGDYFISSLSTTATSPLLLQSGLSGLQEIAVEQEQYASKSLPTSILRPPTSDPLTQRIAFPHRNVSIAKCRTLRHSRSVTFADQNGGRISTHRSISPSPSGLRRFRSCSIPSSYVENAEGNCVVHPDHAERMVRLLVLLMHAPSKQYELISLFYPYCRKEDVFQSLSFSPTVDTQLHANELNNTTQLRSLLNLIPKSASHQPLQQQRYTGFCRPYDGGIELINSLSVQEYEIQEDEVLIAIPKGLRGKDCALLAGPILADKKLARLLKRLKKKRGRQDGADVATSSTFGVEINQGEREDGNLMLEHIGSIDGSINNNAGTEEKKDDAGDDNAVNQDHKDSIDNSKLVDVIFWDTIDNEDDNDEGTQVHVEKWETEQRPLQKGDVELTEADITEMAQKKCCDDCVRADFSLGNRELSSGPSDGNCIETANRGFSGNNDPILHVVVTLVTVIILTVTKVILSFLFPSARNPYLSRPPDDDASDDFMTFFDAREIAALSSSETMPAKKDEEAVAARDDCIGIQERYFEECMTSF